MSITTTTLIPLRMENVFTHTTSFWIRRLQVSLCYKSWKKKKDEYIKMTTLGLPSQCSQAFHEASQKFIVVQLANQNISPKSDRPALRGFALMQVVKIDLLVLLLHYNKSFVHAIDTDVTSDENKQRNVKNLLLTYHFYFIFHFLL
jgi:hypothetical protein